VSLYEEFLNIDENNRVTHRRMSAKEVKKPELHERFGDSVHLSPHAKESEDTINLRELQVLYDDLQKEKDLALQSFLESKHDLENEKLMLQKQIDGLHSKGKLTIKIQEENNDMQNRIHTLELQVNSLQKQCQKVGDNERRWAKRVNELLSSESACDLHSWKETLIKKFEHLLGENKSLKKTLRYSQRSINSIQKSNTKRLDDYEVENKDLKIKCQELTKKIEMMQNKMDIDVIKSSMMGLNKSLEEERFENPLYNSKNTIYNIEIRGEASISGEYAPTKKSHGGMPIFAQMRRERPTFLVWSSSRGAWTLRENTQRVIAHNKSGRAFYPSQNWVLDGKEVHLLVTLIRNPTTIYINSLFMEIAGLNGKYELCSEDREANAFLR